MESITWLALLDRDAEHVEHARHHRVERGGDCQLDIYATARAMRDRGVPLLAIPGNCYDDLAARTGLESGIIERMRELGILYDASGGGELLHFYTAMTGTSLFLEVLERRGGYDGYGAPNSPVMIAAQRRERSRP